MFVDVQTQLLTDWYRQASLKSRWQLSHSQQPNLTEIGRPAMGMSVLRIAAHLPDEQYTV